MQLIRMKALMAGLKAELSGYRLTNKGRTSYAIIKEEFGLRGNKQSVYEQFAELIVMSEQLRHEEVQEENNE